MVLFLGLSAPLDVPSVKTLARGIMESFSWGSAEEGQLGRTADQTNYAAPKEIHMLHGQKIRSVSCGLRHSAFVLQDGTVYTCGSNDKGQLGLDKSHFRPGKGRVIQNIQLCNAF